MLAPLLAAALAATGGLWLAGALGVARSLAAMEDWPVCARRRRTVSAIVAARNEERRLPGLLEPLLGADDRLLEVIVVDDRSSDATPAIVEEYGRRDPRVVLARSPGPPPGWAPKNYALHLGASRARGEVLLFLDADTRPRDGAALVAAAAELAEPRTVVAFVPRFLCRGRLCRAAEAYMTGVANGFYGFHRVRDPGDGLAWMYGCCWAIRREDYRRLGGHEAVKASLVEDRDLAALAKRRGYLIRPVDARDWVGVESYETLRGYAMLVARLAADRAARVGGLRWAALTAAAAAAHLGPLAGLLAAAAAGWGAALAAGVFAAAAQTLLYSLGSWVNRDPPVYGLGGHVGAVAALWGLAAARRGYTWRGRAYSSTRSRT